MLICLLATKDISILTYFFAVYKVFYIFTYGIISCNSYNNKARDLSRSYSQETTEPKLDLNSSNTKSSSETLAPISLDAIQEVWYFLKILIVQRKKIVNLLWASAIQTIVKKKKKKKL